MKYKPQSIRDIGLDVYLEKTREQHNGLGWSDFKQRMELGVGKSKIARDFGKSNQTIWYWVNLYNNR